MTRGRTMPWNLALCVTVFAAGCVFSADYGGGQYRCTDGKCPSGLVCSADQRCVTSIPHDAPPDIPEAVPIDGPPAALTCVDPGPFATAGGTANGTTAGRSSTISASCSGFVMNGADAVYRITAAAGDSFLISVTGLKAYAIAPCTITPSTPACLGNALASPGNPIAFNA